MDPTLAQILSELFRVTHERNTLLARVKELEQEEQAPDPEGEGNA